MPYYVNKNGGIASLTIGGVQLADSLVSFLCSDSSGREEGYVKTEGVITLKQRPGGFSIEDYDRTIFERGSIVLIDIKDSDNNAVRHPRGYLRVIKTLYNASNEQLTVEVGCKLAYSEFVDEVTEDMKALVELVVPPSREDYINIGKAVAANSQIIYQDNQGVLQTIKMFEDDTISSTAPGKWVSVRGVTTVGIQSLDSRTPIDEGESDDKNEFDEPIPDVFDDDYTEPILGDDEIDLEYEEEEEDTDDQDLGDFTETTSVYPLNYPIVFITRKPKDDENPFDDSEPETPANEEDENGDPIPTTPRDLSCPTDNTDDATETPVTEEEDGNPTSCNLDNFESLREPYWVTATSVEVSRTEYEGPAKQQSYSESIRTGPAVEANNQYYADLYHNCVQVNSSTCKPNGNCGIDKGMATVTLSKNTTRYIYNQTDGSLQKTIQEQWAPRIAGAQTFDWRAGKENNQVKGFRTPDRHLDLYRFAATVTEYIYAGPYTQTIETQYVSATTRESGISGESKLIDAYNGIKTVVSRISSSGGLTASNDPERPDTERSPEIETVTKTVTIPRSNPNKKATTKSKTAMPFPIFRPLDGSDPSVTTGSIVTEYVKYIYFWFIGESKGLRITEAMRDDILTDWKPNQPFRYVDVQRNKAIAMRGSAWAWGVTPEESVVSVDGLFMGIIEDPDLFIPNNLLGNIPATLP